MNDKEKEMTVTKEIKWNISDGREITCKIEVVREHVTKERINLDGDISCVDADKIYGDETLTCILDGKVIATGRCAEKLIKPANGAVGHIGRKVGLTEENFALVENALKDAIAEAEADEEIAACLARKKARLEASTKSEAEYEEHCRKMERAMNEGIYK
jgi:hypothetical protein